MIGLAGESKILVSKSKHGVGLPLHGFCGRPAPVGVRIARRRGANDPTGHEIGVRLELPLRIVGQPFLVLQDVSELMRNDDRERQRVISDLSAGPEFLEQSYSKRYPPIVECKRIG